MALLSKTAIEARKILSESNKIDPIIKISKIDYYKIPEDYRGIYSDPFGQSPELKGKKTMLHYSEKGTSLIFEGLHFEII